MPPRTQKGDTKRLFPNSQSAGSHIDLDIQQKKVTPENRSNERSRVYIVRTKTTR